MVNEIVSLLLIISLSSLDSKVCHKIKNEVSVPFCCDNSERRGNECVECPDGYSSTDGEPCQRCQEGSYGRKCRGKCSLCAKTQRCNVTIGCVEGQFKNGVTTRSHEFDVGDIALYSITALGVTALISVCFCILFMACCYANYFKRRTDNKTDQREDDQGYIYDYAYENIMMDQIDIKESQSVREVEQLPENMPNHAVKVQSDSLIFRTDGYLQPVTSTNTLVKEPPLTSFSTSNESLDDSNNVPLKYPYVHLDRTKLSNIHHYSSRQPASEVCAGWM